MNPFGAGALSRAAAAVAIVLMLGLGTTAAAAPLTGTKNIPGSYLTLAAAIADLNAQGVGAGGVTLNLLAGNPQVAPSGGYVIGGAGSPVLTTASASNTIRLQGNNNTITASGVQAAGSRSDAVFKLVGADWVTLTGFTLQENALNLITTPSLNNMTEWGIALLHVSPSDGAQNNTVQSNSISLNRAYANTWAVYSNARHAATSISTAEEITNGTTAPNQANRVYGNIISNVNMGIAFIGSGIAGWQDAGNDIGGSVTTNGNTITNWGGQAADSDWVSNSPTSYGILVNHQVADNVSWNTLTSAAVSGEPVSFRGILKDYTVTTPAGAFTSTISRNTITMTSGFADSAFEAIRSQGLEALATATLNINNNTLLNCAVTAASSAITIVGIANSSEPGTLNMNNNSIVGTASTATSGGFTGITNTGAVVNSISLNGNQVGNATGGAITFSAATSGAVYGIANSGAGGAATLSMQSNDVRGMSHTAAGSGSHFYLFNSAAALAQTISGNTFTNLVVNTTGSVYMIYNSNSVPSGGSKTVSNNSIVTGYSKTGAGGGVYLYYDDGSSVAGVVENNNQNDFSNLAVTGATTVYGWYNNDGGQPTKYFLNNTFSNWTGGTNPVTGLNLNYGWSPGAFTITGNTIRNLAGAGAVTGMSLGGAISTATVAQNTINTLSTTGAAAVQGITSAARTAGFTRNRIYDLSGSNAGTTVNGLLVSGGIAVTVANNLIGDLRATTASATTDAVRGVSLTSATSSSSLNLYDNTIYLNAASSGANFSTSGIYHNASPTATTAALDFRNNIVVNLSTPNGSGITVAYRRSTTDLANYAATSNNNLLYAGTPGPSRLLFHDGATGDQAIGAYRTRMWPRDAASVSQDAPFLGTSGSSASFLHINPAVATPIERGGQPVAGVTDDYDGDLRSATTPDIGADEGAFTLMDLTGPSISYAPLGGSSRTTTRAFNGVVITDPGGVAGAPGTRPRVYYKRSVDANAWVDNTPATNGWKYVEAVNGASPFDFTIDYSRIFGGTVAGGDIIQYFVTAQDLAPSPNVALNAGLFASQPASVALTAAAFPISGAINTYDIQACLSGTRTVGAGGNFATLKDAFDAINAATLCGNLQLTILASGTTETAAATLDDISYEGSPPTVTIRPQAGTTPTITGNIPTAIIILNGADHVLIEGSNSVGGTSRDLRVANTSPSPASAVIWIQTAAGGLSPAAHDNVIRNVRIEGSGPDQTLVGIGSGGTTIALTSLGDGNSNNTIQNCGISKARYGIYSQGADAAGKNTGNVFTQNAINTAAPDNVSRGGILLGFEDQVQVTRNNISGMALDGAPDIFGIALGMSSWSTSSYGGNEVTNATVTANNIGSVVSSGTYSAGGITLAPATSGTTLIANNMISGVSANGTTGDISVGLFVGGGAGSITRIYHNSVWMSGLQTGGSYPGYALAVGGTAPVIDIRNNVFSNTQNTGGGKGYAIGLDYASTPGNYLNLVSDHNDFYVVAAAPMFFVGQTGGLGESGTDRGTLAAWNAETGRDASPASFSASPPFASVTDLHLVANTPTLIESGGVPLAAVTTDYDGEARSAVTPDIGADEGSYERLVTNDIAAVTFIDPASGGSEHAGVAFGPRASFMNRGTATQANVVARYRIVGPAPSTTEVYNRTVTIASIAQGDTARLSFPDATLPSTGSYTMYAKSELGGDQAPGNDQVTGTLTGIAAVVTWDGGGGTTYWGDALNWNPDVIPTAAWDVSLDQASPTTIDASGMLSVNQLAIGSNVTLNLNTFSLNVGAALTQAGSTINCNTGVLNVTGSATLSGGTLNVNAGRVLSLGDFILTGGNLAQGTGTLEIRGAFARASGSFMPDSGTTLFSGTGAQAIGGGVTFNHLVLRSGGAGSPKTLIAGSSYAVSNDFVVESSAQLALSAPGATTVTVGGNLRYSGLSGGANLGSLNLLLMGSGKTIGGASALDGAPAPVVSVPDAGTALIDLRSDVSKAAVLGADTEGKPVYDLRNTLARRGPEVEAMLAGLDAAKRRVALLDDATLVRNPASWGAVPLVTASPFEMNVTVASGAQYSLTDHLSVASGRTISVNGRLNCGVLTIAGAGGITVTGVPGSATNGILATATSSVAGLGATILTTGTNTYAFDPIIEYNANGAQVVSAANHPAGACIYTTGAGARSLAGSKTITASSGPALTKAALSVGSGTTFIDGGNRLSFTTNRYANIIVNGGYLSSGAGAISFETAGSGFGPWRSNVQAVDGTVFGDLLLNFASPTWNNIDLNAGGTANLTFRNIVFGGTAGAGTMGGVLNLSETGTTNLSAATVSLTPVAGTVSGGGFNGYAGATGTVTVSGNITSTSTAAIQPIMGGTGTNTLTLAGSSAQSISFAADATICTGATLKIQNPAGISLVGAATTITAGGTLNLVSGILNTYTRTLVIAAGGSLVRTGGYVVGNLQKNVAAGSSVTRNFEIGSTSAYTPVNVVFTGVTTAGTITATTVSSDHPAISVSGLNPARTANRVWKLTSAGIAFSSADATLNFVAADLDSSANPLAFAAERYDSRAWTLTGAGTVTSTSTQARGLTSFGEFAVGQPTGTAHLVTATSGSGGSISPAGPVIVPDGGAQAFTITPDSCHVIANVLADGVSVGAVSTYTFAHVSADHTIQASFSLRTFTITASAGSNGSISPSGAVSAGCADNVTFTITPAAGYHVGDVLVDGVSVGAATSYTFTDVHAAHTISASFLAGVTSVAEVLLGPGGVFGIYPNPSTPGGTQVLWRMTQAGRASVVIYDIRGRVVRQLEAGTFPEGVRAITWDGRDDDGRAVAAGIFFARFESAGGERVTRRLSIVR